MIEVNAASHKIVVQVKNKDKSKEIVALVNTKNNKKIKVGLRCRIEKMFKLVKVEVLKPTTEAQK